MNIDAKLTAALHDIEHVHSDKNIISTKDIISLIDLTHIDGNATAHDIDGLATKAMKNQVAAICVLPKHLDYISPNINIKRATVINFPTGNKPHLEVLKTIEQTIAFKTIDEIDYVFPYQAYLAQNQRMALSYCHEAYKLCKQHQLTFKVIIETGALPSNEIIYELSQEIINRGCDFLKTSTGKITHGATIPAVFAILAAIVDNNSTCGIKVSGGIKTIEQALSYMQLAHYMFQRKLDNTNFRLGASSLLDVIQAAMTIAIPGFVA